MAASFTISGQLVDLHQRRIFPASVWVEDGRIARIEEVAEAPAHYILPGFADAHIHIESSMLVPTEFAQLAVVHGTVATVSDPHEIANVCGVEGVRFMIENARRTPLKIFFGAPSCVPATAFETAGATLDAGAIEDMLSWPDIHYLAEMMNWPGVLHGDEVVLKKLAAARRLGKPIDGHAPGLRGTDAARYAAAGPSTDHECTTLDEALDKIAAGMKIWIREGSAARNFDALHPLLHTHPSYVAFCSDDKHPDELLLGHINALASRAVALGYDIFDVLRAACVNAVEHYGLPVGLLRDGDAADFIVVENLKDFRVVQTYIDGQLVAKDGDPLLVSVPTASINYFKAAPRTPEDFRVPAHTGTARIRVIEALDGELLTRERVTDAAAHNNALVADPTRDLLKIAVINRYEASAPIAQGFIHGFGLRHGAISSTVAHDCHNIIAVGVDDKSLCAAVNALIDAKGGIAVARGAQEDIVVLPLPVAGLMSAEDGKTVGERYAALDAAAKALGSPLRAPFMTLSFMALLVIPALKMSDRGLFDGARFAFVPVEI